MPEPKRSDDLPELRQARALWARHQIPTALRLFHQTVRRHPRHALALADASRALGSVYQYRRAEALLERLVEIGRGRSEILHLAAQSYRLIRRPERAIECFERALATGTPNADAHLEMALLLERCNQVDRATEHIAARLTLKPGDDEARTVRGRLLRRAGNLTASERLLQAVAEKRSAHWLTRMRAYAELAAVHDQAASYDDAWDAMMAAKSMARHPAGAARRHRDQMMEPLSTLLRDVTPAHFDRWRRAAVDHASQSVALLTGLPRSGTTLLERILAAHSQITTADEWDAFPRLIFPTMLGSVPLHRASIQWLDQLAEAKLARQRRVYLRCLRAALARTFEGQTLVDKNPSLLPLLPVYRRLFPDGKLIIVLRDPRDVLVSCLMTHFPLNDFSVDFLNLDSAAARVVTDLNIWIHLRDLIGGGCVELRYEDLVNDWPAAVLPVLEQLGLKFQGGLTDYLRSQSIGHVNSPSYEAVCQPIYTESIGRWHHYARHLEPVLSRFEPLLRTLGYEL
jgi:hypothetical protein